MKLHIGDGKGWTLDYESEPMPKERFDALIGVAFALIAAAVILGAFALLVSP